MAGQNGARGWHLGAAYSVMSMAGEGGGSMYGPGSFAPKAGETGMTYPGLAYSGSGGSGICGPATSAGANGGSGRIFVVRYYR